jgi:hypothetical protein
MPTDIAAVRLLGRKRRRGRQPYAASAWDYQPFDLHSPVLHPQQEQNNLIGNVEGDCESGRGLCSLIFFFFIAPYLIIILQLLTPSAAVVSL